MTISMPERPGITPRICEGLETEGWRCRVGTCGFGMAQSKYQRVFSCVEVQNTFYQPPQLQTLERWRSQMPVDFEFTVKAWQLITHGAKSPTYRRLKEQLTDAERKDAGYFRPTAIVKKAWEATLASAKALKAQTVLLQCPASFTQTPDNIWNLERFFSTIDRKDLNLCWEPRGNWDSTMVSAICSDLDLSHAVDPFVARSRTPSKCYYRLHGRNGWRYQYDTKELEILARSTFEERPAYVFFNNSKMGEDALRFCELLGALDFSSS